MIHGDVDLTTNLDFYHDKNPVREDDDEDHYSLLNIPKQQLPWKSREHKREIREIENPSYRSISNFTYLTGPSTYWSNIIDRRMFTNYFTGTATTTSTTTYNVYDNRFRYDYSYNGGTPTVTITYDGTASNWSTISTEYNATWSSLINESDLIDTITYDLSDGINIVEEKDEEEVEEKVPELPIFGSKIKDKNYSVMQSCWYCGRTIGKCRCKKKRIGYPDLKDRFCRAFSFNWMDSIDERRAYGYFLRSLFGKKKNKRTYEESQRSIPWLRKLHSHVYEDYIRDLYEEHDYSDYLTNMAWLRIH